MRRIWGRPAAWVCCVMAAAMLLTGCGSPMNQTTITQRHASERIEQLLRGTAAHLTPKPRLKLDVLQSYTGNCLVGENDPRSQVTRSYSLIGLTSHDKIAVGEEILRLWKQVGYYIGSTAGIGKSTPNISGDTQDDFLISLEAGGNGVLSIGATSPCLWPNGTPPPGK